MIMRKLLLFLVSAAAILPAGAQSDTLSADTLHYRMNYHWGFISKTAGEGTVVTRESGDTVSVSFSARSIPWGGRLYSVKDSLVATLKSAPSLSEDVIYENIPNRRYQSAPTAFLMSSATIPIEISWGKGL